MLKCGGAKYRTQREERKIKAQIVGAQCVGAQSVNRKIQSTLLEGAKYWVQNMGHKVWGCK